jgi:[ribosomal protein S18]-alanine N-acetyltransferase
MAQERIEVNRNPSRIEKMEESDLDQILRIEASSGWSSWSRQSFIEELKNPFSHCFTLRVQNDPGNQFGDEIAGFICFRLLGDESELLNLAIHSRHRRKGFGSQLMGFYIDFCRPRKVETFYLETGVTNQPAIRLYQSFAYQPAGIRPRFYPRKEDALLMTRRASQETSQ